MTTNNEAMEAAASLIDAAKELDSRVAMHMTANPDLDDQTVLLLMSCVMLNATLSRILAHSVATIINQDEMLDDFAALMKRL